MNDIKKKSTITKKRTKWYLDKCICKASAITMVYKYWYTIHIGCLRYRILLLLLYDKARYNKDISLPKFVQANNDNKTKFIRKLGNALLNYQQMSSHQAVHIALSLQLHRSSRKTMFIKTSPSERRFLMLKSSKLLAKEDDNSEDIMYASFIEKHISRPNTLENLSLAEYTAFYHNMSTNF